MKITLFEVEPREHAAFDALAGAHSVQRIDTTLSARNAGSFADSDIISTFVNSVIEQAVLDQLPKLKMIATRSTGFDHIDTALCAERGILVSNVPVYGDNTVAEHVFALLLALSHRLFEAVARVRTGPFSPVGLVGFDLSGKTIGVIGTGAIGRHVIKIANGFGMRVIAFDAAPDPVLARDLGFAYCSLDELLSTADVLSLHIPSTPQTRNILSADAFAKMKQGTVIINTARGDLIDAHELIKVLKTGHIAAAGLDVLADEPLLREEAELICSIHCKEHDLRNLVADHVLMRMPNVIVTPHSGFNTKEAAARIVQTTLENIDAFLSGGARNLVEQPRKPTDKEQAHV